MCYVANVGDSRAVMSGSNGKKLFPLSSDHKPDDKEETRRIEENGGHIYQTQAQTIQRNDKGEKQLVTIVGPHRVFPGRLSVSRTFGDIEAKVVAFGGNPRCVIADPEIKAFRIKKDHDFIAMGCDGIFDKLSSRDVIKVIWEAANKSQAKNIH